MEQQAISQMPEQDRQKLLHQIPFFKDLSLKDPQQFQLLLEHSKIIELDYGEQIIKKGSIDPTFYFLLKGQLNVFQEETVGNKAIGKLTEGQVFGALSIINEQPRTASLASSTTEKAVLFATDFSVFGELLDFSQIKLTTKLSFFRIVVNNTRWKLEVNKMNEPDHPLAHKLQGIEKFTGKFDTTEELESLAEQAFFLGQLLDLWNSETPANISIPSKPEAPSFGKKIKALFGNKK